MDDPNRWQPLELEVMVAQNGMPLEETVQTFVGSQWGDVTPFALEPSTDGRPPLDPGPPPMLGDPVTDEALQGRRRCRDRGERRARSEFRRDDRHQPGGYRETSSPARMTRSATSRIRRRGAPYEPNVVALGDYGRAVAEYWADGPSSETPPGHWNTIANAVTDSLSGELSIDGGPVDALEWDVKLYLPLNGAMHDSAIAAWGAKRTYDYARPISMIRYMGGLGQSTDRDGEAFDPDGLPLVPDLIEIVTAASSAPGERHAALADHIGEVAVRSWMGVPSDRVREVGGVGWILAVDWVPYQLPTFVTPAFAGYVSGHSSFSRAGAEVLTAITGDPFFPGGLATWTIPADSLDFEAGPSEDVTLQWATYEDASNEAGRSRIYGGIHVWADDLRGREIGVDAGRGAWALARHYFDGTAQD